VQIKTLISFHSLKCENVVILYILTHLRQLTKVTDLISDFAFLLAAKSGKSRIKNPFLDSPKGPHPKYVVIKSVSIKYGLWTTDCGLGIKRGLGIK